MSKRNTPEQRWAKKQQEERVGNRFQRSNFDVQAYHAKRAAQLEQRIATRLMGETKKTEPVPVRVESQRLRKVFFHKELEFSPEDGAIITILKTSYNKKRAEIFEFIDNNPGDVKPSVHAKLEKLVNSATKARERVFVYTDVKELLIESAKMPGLSVDSTFMLDTISAAMKSLYEIRHLKPQDFLVAARAIVMVAIVAFIVSGCGKSPTTTDNEPVVDNTIGNVEDAKSDEAEAPLEIPTQAPVAAPEAPLTPDAEDSAPGDIEVDVTETDPATETDAETPVEVETRTPEQLACEYVELITPEGTATPEMEFHAIDGTSLSIVVTPDATYVFKYNEEDKTLTPVYTINRKTASFKLNPEDGTIVFYEDDQGNLEVGTLTPGEDGGESTFVETPTSEAAPDENPGTVEPEDDIVEAPIDVAQNKELASQVANVEVSQIKTITNQEFTYNENGEQSSEKVAREYTLAYDENGLVVARYSNENGTYQWIKGGPFTDIELAETNNNRAEFLNINTQEGTATQNGKIETVMQTDFEWNGLRILSLARIWLKTPEGQVARWYINSSVWQDVNQQYHWQFGFEVLKDIGIPDEVGLTPDLVPENIENGFRNINNLSYQPHLGFGDDVRLSFTMPHNPVFQNPDGGILYNAPFVFFNSGVINSWDTQGEYWAGDYENSFVTVQLPDGSTIELIIPVSPQWVKDF